MIKIFLYATLCGLVIWWYGATKITLEQERIERELVHLTLPFDDAEENEKLCIKRHESNMSMYTFIYIVGIVITLSSSMVCFLNCL